jgi:LDH2 family malate/lactate/ureidoglycolate dehydrogenase
VDPKEFKINVSSLIEKVKSTKKLPGITEIYAPGERGDRLTNKRIKEKAIEIEDNLYHEVVKVSLRSSSL